MTTILRFIKPSPAKVLAHRQRKLLIFSRAQLIDGQGNVQVPADSVADRLLPRAALAALDQQHFDLLFLDLKLADGPPDDVHDLAKNIDPELSIIIITGYPDSEMLDRILEEGPITILKKPLQVDQLRRTVRILGHKEIAKAA